MEKKYLIAAFILSVSLFGGLLYRFEHVFVLMIPLSIFGMFLYTLIPGGQKKWFLLATLIFIGSGMRGYMEEYFGVLAVGYTIFNFAPMVNSVKRIWRVDLVFLSYYLGLLILNPSNLQIEALKFHVIYLLLLHVFVSLKLTISDMIGGVTLILHLLWVIYAFGEVILIPSGFRVSGPVLSATCFGALLVQSWSMLVVYWVVEAKSFKRVMLYSLPGLLAILSTGTRSCLAGVFLTYLFVIFYRENTRSWIFHIIKVSLIRGGPILILVGLFILSPWGELFLDRLLATKTKTGIDMSSFGRLAAWYTAGEIFSIKPFFGVGQGQFQDFMKGIFPVHIFTHGSIFTLRHAHNAFFVLVSETGLWGLFHGLVLLLFSWYGIMSKSGYFSKARYPLLISLLVTLGLGLLDNIPFYDYSIFMGVWLLSMYLFDYKKKI